MTTVDVTNVVTTVVVEDSAGEIVTVSTPASAVIDVTNVSNTVAITESGGGEVVTAYPPTAAAIVEVVGVGPQGPPGYGGGINVSDTSKVDKSVVYYDANEAVYKADATWTTATLVDGANF